MLLGNYTQFEVGSLIYSALGTIVRSRLNKRRLLFCAKFHMLIGVEKYYMHKL